MTQCVARVFGRRKLRSQRHTPPAEPAQSAHIRGGCVSPPLGGNESNPAKPPGSFERKCATRFFSMVVKICNLGSVWLSFNIYCIVIFAIV